MRHAPRYVLAEVGEDPERLRRIETALGEMYRFVEQLSPFDRLCVRRAASAPGSRLLRSSPRVCKSVAPRHAR
jgi:hypothetical protein